jgi:hypothetical protein
MTLNTVFNTVFIEVCGANFFVTELELAKKPN